jgi:lactate dehydrogenase-like 2-hydroxyacid dehydrogenase
MFQAKAIATRVNAFGLDVVYHARHAQADAAYRYYLSLLDMAKDVDILIVAASGGSRRRRDYPPFRGAERTGPGHGRT